MRMFGTRIVACACANGRRLWLERSRSSLYFTSWCASLSMSFVWDVHACIVLQEQFQ